MLRSISWTAFGEAVLILLFAYYALIGGIYFRKEILAFIRRWSKHISIAGISVLGTEAGLRAQTADANTGINQANTLVRSYYDAGTQLMYAIGGIVALAGAFHVFNLMQHERRNEARTAAISWFGACIFLVVVASVIRSFFGL